MKAQSAAPENEPSGEKTEGGSDNGLKLTPETRQAIEGLLEKMVGDVMFGYKTMTDPVQRELAHQSEGTAEKLFAYLYADDPENAKLKWQNYTGRPADQGLLSRTKNLILEKDAEKILPMLTRDQEKASAAVNDFMETHSLRQRKNEMSNLRVALGDAQHRTRDYRRKATKDLLQVERDPDGLTVLKGFFKGGSAIADDYVGAIREWQKGRALAQAMKGIVGGRKEGQKVHLRQEFAGMRSGRSNTAGADMAQSAGKAVWENAAKAFRTVFGKNGKVARDNAPEPVKQILLPSPRHFGREPIMGMLPPPPQLGL